MQLARCELTDNDTYVDRFGDLILAGERRVYRCVDCGYTTPHFEWAECHQANQRRHHTWWQRLRRRWAWPEKARAAPKWGKSP